MARRRRPKEKRPRPKTPRGRLMRKIENKARAASSCRLAGNIQQALTIEGEVDRLVSGAEGKGWADSALLAEQRGQQKASG